MALTKAAGSFVWANFAVIDDGSTNTYSTFTDVDLSAVTGSQRVIALVYFANAQGLQTKYCTRVNGDTTVVTDDKTQATGDAHYTLGTSNTNHSMLLVCTDTAAIFELKANNAGTDKCKIVLLAYCPVSG